MKMKILMMVVATVLAGLTFSVPSHAATLSAQEIEQSIIGKRVYLKIPFGGEFPLVYRKNGVVQGDGTAVGVGRFFSPTDKGRWWFTGNQLCQKWEEWYKGRTFCFVIKNFNGEKFTWHRDDGRKGKARIE